MLDQLWGTGWVRMLCLLRIQVLSPPCSLSLPEPKEGCLAWVFLGTKWGWQPCCGLSATRTPHCWLEGSHTSSGEGTEFPSGGKGHPHSLGLPALLGGSQLCLRAAVPGGPGTLSAPLTCSFSAQVGNSSDARSSCVCATHASSVLEIRPCHRLRVGAGSGALTLLKLPSVWFLRDSRGKPPVPEVFSESLQSSSAAAGTQVPSLLRQHCSSGPSPVGMRTGSWLKPREIKVFLYLFLF